MNHPTICPCRQAAPAEARHAHRLLLLLSACFSMLLPAAAWGAPADTLCLDEAGLPIAIMNVEASVPARSDSAVCPPLRKPSASTAFRPRQLIFPTAAIAVGCAGIRSHLIDTRGERKKQTFDNTLQYLPTVAYVGLGFIPGVKHEHRIGSRMMAGVTAFAIMTALCQGTKRLVGEPRPDTGAKTSFPSGHTATAFMGAELCRLEYGWGYGAAAYAVAAVIGGMRVYNNRHWCNDVLAGAGVGVLSAQAAYWLLPLEERLFKGRRSRAAKAPAAADVLLMPTYDGFSKSPGLAFSCSF